MRGAAVASRVAVVALAVVAIALLPRLLSDFRAGQAGLVAVYFVALIGLNILTGLSGQVSLGHGAFMAVGGYVTAILVSDQGLELFGHTFSSEVRDIWTLPLAGILAGVAGLLFGLPATRLAGAYLALATFGIGVALPAILRKAESLTGGGSGINLFGLPKLSGLGVEVTVFGRTLTYNDWLYYSCWTVALVLLGVSWLLLRGRLGRSLRAVRDAEAAAVSSGVSPMAAKTAAFAISAFYAGVAGGLYAMHTTFVNPGVFDVTLSIFLARRRRRRRARDDVDAGVRRRVHRLPPGRGPGDLEGARRAGDRLRRRPHRADARPPGRRRRARAPPSTPLTSRWHSRS